MRYIIEKAKVSKYINYHNSHKGNNQDNVLKINKDGFMLHGVVRGKFSKRLRF